MRKTNIEKYNHDAFEKEGKPYTMILNQVIQQMPAAHMCAAFMWVYLQSLPPTWTPSKAHLMKHFDISERTYKNYMKTLVDFNLVSYDRERYENGQLGRVTIRVLNGSRFPLNNVVNHSAENCTVDHHSENHHSAKKPLCGEMTPLINTIDNTNKENSLREKRPSATKPKEKKAIKRTKKPHTALLDSAAPLTTESKHMAAYKETLYPMPSTAKQSSSKGLAVDDLTQDNPHRVPTEMIEDWLSVRKLKRLQVTATAWRRLNHELAKCANPLEAFEIMVAHGWTSLNHTWVERITQDKKSNGHFDYDDTSWAEGAKGSIFR